MILALDSDFLDCGQGDLASVARFHFAPARERAEGHMNRLYVVENRFTLTGAMADHRLRCPASQIPAFAHALATKIRAGTNDRGLGSVSPPCKSPTARQTLSTSNGSTEWPTDLMAKPGASLVLAGPHQPVAVQLLVYAINAALKNVGQTLRRAPVAAQPEDNRASSNSRRT